MPIFFYIFSQFIGEEIEARREIEPMVEVVLEFPSLVDLKERSYLDIVTFMFNREVEFFIRKLKTMDSFFALETDPEIRSGLEHYMQGNYDLAINKLYPSRIDPLVDLYIARAYLKNGEINEAKNTFDEILDTILKIDSTERFFKDVKEVIDFSLGEIEFRLEDYEEALSKFINFIERHKWSSLRFSALAYILLCKYHMKEKGTFKADTMPFEEKRIIDDIKRLRKIKNIEFYFYINSLLYTYFWYHLMNDVPLYYSVVINRGKGKVDTVYYSFNIPDEVEYWRNRIVKLKIENEDENIREIRRWVGLLWFTRELSKGKVDRSLKYLRSIGDLTFADVLKTFYLYHSKKYEDALRYSFDIFTMTFPMRERWLKEIVSNILIGSILNVYDTTQTFVSERELIKYGGSDIETGMEDWRSIFLFHLGEYIYRHDPIRAKDIMIRLIDDKSLRYTRGYYMARIALGWVKMQVYRFDEAEADFKWVFRNTSYRESIVLGAYGIGLTNLYQGDEQDLIEAVGYFRVERIHPSDTTPTIYELIKRNKGIDLEGLPIVDSLKDDNLWYLGQTYEGLNSYLDAIDVYRYILNNYSGSVRAPDAAQRLVDIYSMASVTYYREGDYSKSEEALKNAERYMDVVRKYVKSIGKERYKGYGIALASLYRAYIDLKKDRKAIDIGEEMKRELSIKEPLETYYYIRSLEDSTVSQLEQDYIKLKEVNPKSKHLPEVMFKLVSMYNQEKSYRKMIPLLEELEEWSPYEDVRMYMPDVIRILGIAYYSVNQKDKALAKLEKFVRLYPSNKYTPPIINLIASIYIEKGDEVRKKGYPYEKYREFYQKALEYIEKLETEYGNEDYYNRVKDEVEQKKKYCYNYL